VKQLNESVASHNHYYGITSVMHPKDRGPTVGNPWWQWVILGSDWN